jgi:hypothetical protein
MRRVVLLVLVLALGAGCYRTRYENFSPANPLRSGDAAATSVGKHRWEHFFLYGLAPVERFSDARFFCNGAENVFAVETQRTFPQALVSVVAGYYILINIYSPWDATIECREPEPR